MVVTEIKECLFDNSLGYDDETGVKVASGLTSEQTKQAVMLYRLFNELWGLCIVVGDPGTGKDLFGNWLAYRIKTYFPWKRIMRDEKPRELFGSYAGLFNEEVLVEELGKMREISKSASKTKIDAVMDKVADDWVSSKGQVMLKNSLLYLTEFWKYCYCREPHNPMNKTMGGIHKVKRHLDCLIVGTVQDPRELDKYTCLPWVDWKVTSTRSSINKTGFVYFIQKVKYDRREEVLVPIGRPFPIAIDAGKPRSEMGDGKIVIKKRDYLPANEEERIILGVINSGAEKYEEIVETLENYGDMTEKEILNTLKELRFNRRKRVIDYPTDFGLYNSKSSPSINTSLRGLSE